MNLAATLFCAVSILLSVQAITVSVDRADVRPITSPSNPSQSMVVNGWRPLTSYDTIGVNVSPASNLDRSYAPLHPVLGKLQEHMTASERAKTQHVKAQQPIEYSPPSILGSFAVFNQATSKQRKESLKSSDPKTLSTEREYSFLIPPPRDALRFDLESQKKISVLSEPYVRSSQFIPQAIKPDPRSPTYYIKPASFSTAVHPFSQARPFVNNYNVQQSLGPARQPMKQFEGLKPSNEKPYFQPSEINSGFNKDNKPNNEQAFVYQQQQQAAAQQQIANSNYYNQINHPTHYKQPTFERNPGFLVHESHEVSYVTPPNYKFRPSNYHFANPNQEAFPSSTVPPKVESNKFVEPQSNNARPEGLTKYQTNAKEADKHHGQSNAYYIQDFQKTRYAPDINEVLPKVNQPVKFHQIATTAAPYVPDHNPKVVYVRPELQQQQYQSSIIPLNINQRPSEVDYETPESVSLKHFNEQQFLLQQQLIQQDRQRLREHEKRRQQELQRQQEEEVRKRQQEIKLLEQKHKEKQRLEQLQTQEPEIVKEALPNRHQYSQPYPIDEQKKIPQEQYKHVYHQQQFEVPQTSTETPFVPSKQVTVQKFEEVFVTPIRTQGTDEDFQPVIRPYRPLKPLRDQIRRRKPTTVSYDPTPTELPTVFNPETSESLTDVPIQTTSLPEVTTVPVTERIIRTRRPGAQLRRRRPTSTTTTTQEPIVSSQEYNEEILKYNTPENQEFEKKKRIRPVNSNQDSSLERRPLRKRPGQRGKGYKEHGDFVERVKTTEQPFREISATDNYPEPFLKELYSSEIYNPTSEKTLSVESSQESSTESIPVEYYIETTPASSLEYYEPTHEDRQEYYTQKAEEQDALDHVFSKTEVNYIETSTTPYPSTTSTTLATTTTTTTTTTEPPTTPKAIISLPKVTHRTRPMRYGNATRPRFSIKDYKSRMDYKNRLAQSSSTEPSTVTAGPKVRGHKNQQAPADPSFKEASGRYKHMSRSSYRTTSTTTPTSYQPDDNSATTDKNSRFTPKKRINTSHYYRSRVTTTGSPNKQDQDHSSAHSTARPENVFSSSIRKRPTLKSRLQPSFSADRNKLIAHSEMQSAAETAFYATTTVGSIGLTEAANEIGEHEESEKTKIPNDNQGEKATVDLSDITMEENDEKEKYHVPSENNSEDKTHLIHEEVTEIKLDENQHPTSSSSILDSTTPFDIRHEEELFAKASQSVADLTSSASALYDKPGMFKAVSPANENRAISAHLKIATDEPTLPIEAFFQEIAKQKN